MSWDVCLIRTKKNKEIESVSCELKIILKK